MKRKFLAFTIAVLLVLCFTLTGCENYTEGAATIGNSFVKCIAARNYSDAYDYIYSFTSDVQSRQDFIDRFNNIYDALEITEVKLVDHSIEEKADEENAYQLTYTMELESELIGKQTYDFSTDIVAGPLGFTVIYTPSLILPMLEEGDTVRIMNQQGVRGEIFAADGKLLAKNDFAQSVYIDLDKKPDITEVKNFLVDKFNADAESIMRRYDNAIEKNHPIEVLLTFPRNTLTQEQIDEITAINGLGVDDQRMTPTRHYPLADNAAHLVGYMGSPTADQLENDPSLSEYAQVGQTGIEAAYESTMRSTDGRIIYIQNTKGDMKDVLYEDAKSDGSDVYLTIDTTLQNTAYTLIAANCTEGQSGAVIVMDYTNGDVKAMVSYPSFDTNLFNFPMDPDIYDYYTSEENLTPLFSRTTQALYMPGSTLKPFTSVPMFETGTMDEQSSPPFYPVNNEWIPQFEGWRYGKITRAGESAFVFEESMKSSDNIFFAYWALRTGEQPMKDYMDRIGIGEKPDFELPLAKSSLMNKGSEWNIGLLARSGYGMGELHITPLQLCTMYTAFMNDGDILNPTVVKKVSKTTESEEVVEWENSKTVWKEDIMQTSTLNRILPSLRRVITDGTAWQSNLQGVKDLFGKTGTANIGEGNSRDVNWFITVDPNPEKPYIYLVMLDTKNREGTKAKLAIMHGLVVPEDYSLALTGKTGFDAPANSSQSSEE